MILLNEINQILVKDYSCVGEELEYVLVENTPENRKKIELALAMQFNWCIVDMGDKYSLTAGGHEILKEHSGDDYINVAGIIFDELPHEVIKKIQWSKGSGFVFEEVAE